MNIIDYVKNYKNKTFDEEPFNEIDNLIFSALSYIDFRDIIPNDRNYISLEWVGIKFFEIYDALNIKIADTIMLDNIELLRNIYSSIRYRDILLYNYVHIINKDTQFCALTFKLKNNIVIAFQGTDETLVGWKEDFEMAYTFPVQAQIYAINYLNNTIKLFDKNIIVLGHSKGGNLALVSSMYASSFIRHKIKHVYSNDGQGLRKREIESKEYQKISKKFTHILPNYSYIGVLLRSDEENEKVVRTSKRGPYAHHIFNWEINDKSLIETFPSNFSINLRKSVIMWLDDHNDDKRKLMINTIFKILEDSNVKTTYDFKNIKTATTIIKNMQKIDEETKNLAIDFLKFNISYIMENRK